MGAYEIPRRPIMLTVLTISLFVSVMVANVDAQQGKVISLQAEMVSLPSQHPAKFTCTVVGSVVWDIIKQPGLSINTFDRPDNVTDGLEVGRRRVPIKILNYEDGDGRGVSLLIFLPEFTGRNGTEVFCDATTSGFDRTNMPMKDKIRLYDPPTPPSNVRVTSEGDLYVYIEWNSSFVPFDIPVVYSVIVNGSEEISTDENFFNFTRSEPSCFVHEIFVEAMNDAGKSQSKQPLMLSLPSIPDTSRVDKTLSEFVQKTVTGISMTINFEAAAFCHGYPVTSYSVVLSPTVIVVINDPAVLSSSELSIVVNSTHGLKENTRYTYHIVATNSVGSRLSSTREFYTSDVYTASAVQLNSSAVLLRCEFVQTSDALGCVMKFQATQFENMTYNLYRSSVTDVDNNVEQVVYVARNLSCYENPLVFDIESDNTTSDLGLPVILKFNGSLLCTASVQNQDSGDLTLAVKIGIGGGCGLCFIVVLIIVTVILITICKSSSRKVRNGSRVKDTSRATNNVYKERYFSTNHGNYTNEEVQMGANAADQPPLYDTVENCRPTVL